MDVLTVDTLAEALKEPKRTLLMKVLRTLGVDRATAILADTLTCEANGGMLTKDGTRRRTSGGVFFQLVRERATKQERRRLFPRSLPQQRQGPTPPQPHAQPQPLPWEELLAIVTTLPKGEATVKLTLLGRPDLKVLQTQPTYVAFRMQGQEASSLPKGLPPVPGRQPITWLVVIALRQWRKVEENLRAHADDKLIVEGHPVVTGDGTHVLLVQSCVSMLQQRAQKQVRQSQAETATA